jgi:WD40 repeat protein
MYSDLCGLTWIHVLTNFPIYQTDVRYSVELRGHTDSVDQLEWDPTHADRLATASCDRTVRLWDQRSE